MICNECETVAHCMKHGCIPKKDFWEGYVPEPQYKIGCVNHDCDKCKAAAQPAIPDAFGTREGEHPAYIQGWNDCRAEMLNGRKT